MTDRVKQFIEENINLIENNQWEEVYKRAKIELAHNTGKFTEVMLQANIHPENYLEELPGHFLEDSTIKEFKIPRNIIRICNDAFSYCTSFTSITIPDGVTSIGQRAFESCTSLMNVTIGNGVTSIGYYAFAYCDSLTSVIIPDSVTSIGDYAFDDCGDNLIIDYQGSKEDWKKIYDLRSFQNTYFIVNCSDGKIVKNKR